MFYNIKVQNDCSVNMFYSDGIFEDDFTIYNEHMASVAMTMPHASCMKTTDIKENGKKVGLDYSDGAGYTESLKGVHNIDELLTFLCNMENIFTNHEFTLTTAWVRSHDSWYEKANIEAAAKHNAAEAETDQAETEEVTEQDIPEEVTDEDMPEAV